jgi:aminoglycoside phosphotransferase (APT) family kinase protein
VIAMQINEALVKKLLQEQFPQWQDLPVQAVAQGGWDNYTFHLGTDMLVRLPRDAEHAIYREYAILNN